jgi:uncharacterized protein
MTVFADAFFYVALINRHDSYHLRAATYAHAYRGAVLTTEWVLAEVADALAASRARQQVRAMIEDLKSDPSTHIVEASSHLFIQGLELYDKRPDKEWSLTDCISFVVMESEGVHEAPTGDRHFAQAGFLPIFAE